MSDGEVTSEETDSSSPADNVGNEEIASIADLTTSVQTDSEVARNGTATVGNQDVSVDPVKESILYNLSPKVLSTANQTVVKELSPEFLDSSTVNAPPPTTTSSFDKLPSAVDLQALLNTFSNPDPPLQTDEQSAQDQSNLPAANVQPTKHDGNHINSTPVERTDTARAEESYDQFLLEERRIMGHTAPGSFEAGSRLFVGNITAEPSTKRELFHIFRGYGKLAQISLKATFGFVQFLSALECRTAMESEQGRELGLRKLHLEVSKPQVPRQSQPVRRRSRSPQYRRESPSSERRQFAGYGRDAYEVDDRHGHRSSDRSQASQSSPYERPRNGPNIPSVQLVVTDEMDRVYIQQIENTIRRAGLSCESLFISPKLHFADLVRQMVADGVSAIVICNRRLQAVRKVDLQTFFRAGNSTNVQFEEYASIDVDTAIQLIQRVLRGPAVPTPSSVPQLQQQNLAAMISQMDPATLAAMISQIQNK